MTQNKRLPLLILGLLIGGSLLLHYHTVIFSPNTTYMGGSVDGLKNYYTPWYHAKYDSSYVWFEGMNYPYGEHVVFTDAQPLLSNAIKLVSNVVDISDYTVGIINYLLLLSLFFTGWLVYKIMRHFQVAPLYAAIAGGLITLLSPQMLRWTGHYALGYTFYIPLIWYLALWCFKVVCWKRSAVLAGVVFAFAWLHPYYLMIAAVFLSAFWLMHLLMTPRSMKFTQRLFHFGIQVILPGLLFMVLMKLSDPVTDRPQNPYGFEEYFATWRQVFLPYAVSFLSWGKDFQQAVEQNWEGVAYVGVSGGLLFLFFWLRMGWRLGHTAIGRGFGALRRRWWHLVQPSRNLMLSVSVGAGLLVFLFSCGFPFSIKPELMTDLFPPIKQFRSLGRFAWVFYYTWTVFAFYLLYLMHRRFRMRGQPAIAWTLTTLLLGYFFLETYGFNHGTSLKIKVSKTPKMAYGQPDSPWIGDIDPDEYCAMIALPYFHEGSENLSALNWLSYKEAFETSIKTGLPMLNVMMSRTSLAQTWSHFQLVTEPYAPLEILPHMTDPRPVLAIRTGRRQSFDGSYLQPYAQVPVFPIDFRNMSRALEEAVPFPPDSFLVQVPGAGLNRADGSYYFEDFEKENNSDGYLGSAGKTLALDANNWLYYDQVDANAGDTLLVSAWLKLRGDRLPATLFGVEEKTAAGDLPTWSYPAISMFVKALDGDWALCERELVLADPADTVKVNITRWRKKPPSVVVDRFMIRKKGTDVWMRDTGGIGWLNNRKMRIR